MQRWIILSATTRQARRFITRSSISNSVYCTPSIICSKLDVKSSCLSQFIGLYQGNEVFTRAQLDAIANELTLIDPEKNIAWNPLSVVWKPHHNALTGNYDINVLFAALESKGKEVVWYDRRNTASSMDLNQSLIGIVLNKQVRKLGGLWRSRHWIALRKIDGVWHNLDSDLPAPLAFENGDEELRDYLDQILAQGGEALMVFEASSAPPNRAEQ